MWILSCDGDLFEGKRLWLKPGTRHLFGRTKPPSGSDSPGEKNHVISHKSVSRQHLTITVDAVKPGDGSNLSAKATLTLTDDSKFGTTIDGEKFVKESRQLTGTDHAIQLGSYDQKFRITWQPVVITFASTSRDLTNALPSIKSRLEEIDVKTSIDYVVGHTTHVIADKRNTAKGLQALVNAKHIVTASFIDAIFSAASSTPNQDDPDNPLPSRLEMDFDKGWPREMEYLPAVGKEPVPRPGDIFTPNPERQSVFEGYTFVFCDQTQFENLQPPITNGGGKALYYELVEGQTTAEDLMHFIRKISKQKMPEDREGGDARIILVRYNGSKGFEDWADNFKRETQLLMGWRSVQQNEFLDAILMNDASVLRRELEDEDRPEAGANSSSMAAPPLPSSDTVQGDHAAPSRTANAATATSSSTVPLSSSAPTPSKPSRRARRAITTSRFKGFDDIEPSSLPKATQSSYAAGAGDDDDDEVMAESSHRPASPSQRPSIIDPSQSQHPSPTQSRKRRHADVLPEEPDEDEPENPEDVLNALVPAATAAAAAKRRRLATTSSRPIDELVAEDARNRKAEADAMVMARKSRKQDKDIDVMGLARERRAQEEERRVEEEERLRESLEGLDIAHLRDLVQVEEMEVRASRRSARGGAEGGGGGGGEWDERWNGRKNFKKFRRKGAVGEGQTERPRKVIVPLEEVRKKDFGIGEAYWLKDSAEGTQRRESGTQSQSQSQAGARGRRGKEAEKDAEDEGDALSFRRRRKPRTVVEEEEEGEDVVPEEIIEPPRNTRLADKAREARGKEAEPSTQTLRSGGEKKARGKRAAPAETAAEAPPAKKAKGRLDLSTQEESEGSGDELRFKFRRRR